LKDIISGALHLTAGMRFAIAHPNPSLCSGLRKPAKTLDEIVDYKIITILCGKGIN